MKTPVCKQPFEIMKGKIPFKNTVQHVYEETVVLLAYKCGLGSELFRTG